jgi:DGQHR domain-containing protein
VTLDPDLAHIDGDRLITPKGEYRLDSEGKVRYSVAIVEQGKTEFFTCTMYSDVLAATSFVTTRDEDPISGFQRYLNRKKAQEIADYIDQGLTIPTPIILSAQPDAAVHIDRRKTIAFNPTNRSFLIIDGQHRVWGFALAKTRVRIPVVVYSGLSRKEESRIFIDINTKQSRVPNELIFDIRQQAGIEENEENLLTEAFNYFMGNDDSSLFGKMSPHERIIGKISRVTFNESINLIIVQFPERDPFYIYSRLNPYFAACLIHLRSIGAEEMFYQSNTFKTFVAALPLVVRNLRMEGINDLRVDDYHKSLEIVFRNNTVKGILKNRITSYKKAVQAISKAFDSSVTI